LEDEHPDFKNNERVVNAVAWIRQKIETAGYSISFKDHINSLYIRGDVARRLSARAEPDVRVPSVSVGLPIYNRADMLEAAVRSIRGQTFSNFELLISDNCSPDPTVSRLCVAWAEEDPRITYVRQPTNHGAARNFLYAFSRTNAPLFMWASDDDLWDREFLHQAVRALTSDPKIGAWMCHIRVVDSSGAVVHEIPNLSRFRSSMSKQSDLAKFIAQPESLGKANLFYSVFRRQILSEALSKVRPYLNDWGSDMLLLYSFLCRANINVDPKIFLSKRLAPRELGFEPVEPRRNIVPWEHAARYYGAMIDVAGGTPYRSFTKLAVRARYLYDVLYWRLKLKLPAPWRPSGGATPGVYPLPFTGDEINEAPVAANVDSSAATKTRFIDEFRAGHYVRHNQRRQEHLASLGLPIEGRSVLELGAGIGDHTTFFLDRNCSICVSDGRQELYEIIRDRYSWMRSELLDLEKPNPAFQDRYEIVYAYGLLYHLANPGAALEIMANWCSDMLLLETAVSAREDVTENLVPEVKELGSQAISGTGSRPSRKWLFEKLKTLFPYVYVTKTQPWHPEFPLDWNNPPTDTGYTRSVFVASRTPLILPTLSSKLVDLQVRH
jgi:glycosyltransferase involved in cell wall biosynthesis